MNQIEFENFPINDLFNQQLINCLPGMFYVYKFVDKEYVLFACNKKHLMVTGYTMEESIEKNPLFFVDNASYKSIVDGIKEIKTNGFVKQVYANIKPKIGRSIPYVFEGYKFNVESEDYFMGLGIDISDMVTAKEQIVILALEKEKKEQELLSLMLREQTKTDLLHTISKKLEILVEKKCDPALALSIQSLTTKINSHFKIGLNWKNFQMLFNNIHQSFFEEINREHPVLTKGDLKYCAYIKMQMGNEQICGLMNITHDGLKKKRYRIRKKMKLSKNINLDKYILQF